MSNAKMWTFGLLPMLLILMLSDAGLRAQYKPGTSFDGRQAVSAEVCPSSSSFMSEKDVNDLITEMLRRISAKNRFIVISCSRVDNCQAVIYGGKPYILFNPEFLGSIRRLNFSSAELPKDIKKNDWEALTILAHEIGHHINNHISNPPPDVPQRDLELEADEFAGSMIARMGATMEQAFLAYASLPENGNYTHPDRKSRLQAIEKGWMAVSPVPTPVIPQSRSERAEKLLKKGIEQYENEDYKGAFSIFSSSDLSSNDTAQLYLGLLYGNGRGVARDDLEAVNWYSKSAEQGNAEAQHILGLKYLYGKSVSQDDSQALTWFKKSAEQGNASSQGDLGWMYENGRAVPKDYSEAVNWYSKSADKGNMYAQAQLGNMYFEGRGVATDISQAFYWYKKSADQGYTKSQNHVGMMYRFGMGTHKNESEAIKWYIKSAEKGDTIGQIILGAMYENGEGVPRNYSEAVNWFKKAEEQGSKEALDNLVRIYRFKEELKYDVEGLKWTMKAAEQGDADGQYILGDRYANGLGVQRDYYEALKWYKKSAEQGYDFAQNELGMIYEYGRGVRRDYKEALKWYEIASKKGNPVAKENYLRLYGKK